MKTGGSGLNIQARTLKYRPDPKFHQPEMSRSLGLDEKFAFLEEAMAMTRLNIERAWGQMDSGRVFGLK